MNLFVCNRDRDTVLKEDRAALRAMQKQQPRFTEEQKSELSQVHPWIRTGRLPRAINVSVSSSKQTPTLMQSFCINYYIKQLQHFVLMQCTTIKILFLFELNNFHYIEQQCAVI